MADSDDEYDGRRRDKFVRERNDYSNRASNLGSSGGGGGWQDNRSDNRQDNWSYSHRPQSNYQRNDSYAPKRDRYGNQQIYGSSSAYEPTNKRIRLNHWSNDDRSQVNYESNYNGNSYNNSNQNELTLTQPPYMSFKQFMRGLDDSIDHHEAAKKYNEYKLDFKRKQIAEFFNAHKDEEWFRIKYHPVESVRRKKELRSYVKHRAQVFMDLYNKGIIQSTTVDIEKSDEITNVLDSIVIKLEGGTDYDLKCLETPKEEPITANVGETGTPVEDGSNTPVAELSNDEDAANENGEIKPIDAKVTKLNDQSISSNEEKVAEEEMACETSENLKSNKEEDDKEDGEADDEPEKDETGKQLDQEIDSDQAKKCITNETNNDNATDKELKNQIDENEPKPLHKTLSIFLRYLPANVTKDEVVRMFKTYDGYLRVALADPTFDKRFQRRGWVTFDRNVDIRRIFLSLANVKILDCEFGAIINRDLSRRIRSVNGIASHRNCVLTDLKHTTQIILNLDEERGVWNNVVEEPVSIEPKQSDSPVVDQPAEQQTDQKDDESKDESASNNEQESVAPAPLLDPIPEYHVEGLPENIVVFGQQTKNPLLIDIEQILREKADPPTETVNEETGEIKEEEINEEEPKQLERDEDLIKVLDKLVFYLRVVHSLDFYNHVDYPNEDEMPNRIGIMHARGMVPTANITLKEVNDYIRQFENRISSYLERSVQLNDDEIEKLGKRKIEDEIEKFIAENTKEIKTDKWLCPLSGKKFKGPNFIRKHIETKHSDKLEKVRQETEFFNLYLADPRRPLLAEHPFNRPGYKGNQYNQSQSSSVDHHSINSSQSNYNNVHQRVNFNQGNRYSNNNNNNNNNNSGWVNSYNNYRNGGNRYNRKRSYRDLDQPTDY